MRLNVYAAAVATILLLACVQTPASASGWWLRWDNGNDEQCFAVDMDQQGNVIAAGFYHPSGNNIWRVAKYNPSGSLLWEQTSGPSWGSTATDVATDASGNIYVCGYYPGTGGGDWKIIKYNSNGDSLRGIDLYTGSGADEAQGIAVDPSGNVVVVGITNSSGNNQWTVVKLDPNLSQLWEDVRGPSWGSDAQDVATDASGNIYVCGYYPGTGGGDWKIIKYNSNGDSLRGIDLYTGSGADEAQGIAVDPSGNVVVVGITNSSGNNQWTVVKLDPNLSQLWEDVRGPSWGSDAQDVATDASGNIYVCGYYPGTGGGDWKIIKYNSNGDSLRGANVDEFGPGSDEAYGVAVRQGYCTVVGVSGSNGALDWAIWHYDTDGLAVAEGTPTRGPSLLTDVASSPNPFARQTQISYSLPNEADVVLEVCSSAGRVITTLVSGRQSAGTHAVSWDANGVSQSTLPNGAYFCRLKAGEYTATRKMVKTD